MTTESKRLKQILQNAQTSNHLNLNIDEEASVCRKLFLDFVKFVQKSADLVFPSIFLLEIPTDQYSVKEEDFLCHLFHLSSLKVCILKGGRRKSGVPSRGGLVSLPDNFGRLKSITSLDLSFNKFSSVPCCIGELTNLVDLKIDFNSLETAEFPFKNLTALKSISATNNKVQYVSEKIHLLPELQCLNLASNKLTQLPSTLCYCEKLTHLNVSKNCLKCLPNTLFKSKSLVHLSAAHNDIDQLDFDHDDDIALQCLDLQYNFIQLSEDSKLPSCILLQGNVPRPNGTTSPGSQIEDDYDVPKHFLDFDTVSVKVQHHCGGRYTLPSGVQITFPKGCLTADTELFCKLITDDASGFDLDVTDQLLSSILDMRPNGLEFKKPVRIELPFSYSGFDHQKRHITMRAMSHCLDGSSTCEDLNSELITQGGISKVVGYTSHFSLFGAISKLIEDSIEVKKDRSCSLISSANPQHKIKFEENSVQCDTTVTMQVLSVDQNIVHEVTETTDSFASDILLVDVLPETTVFDKPVTVHLGLPYQLIGKSFDRSKLRLMKCSDGSETWNDITSTVDLIFSTLDVSFKIDTFCMFSVIWSNVNGVMRKIFQRQVSYQVQFIAMQRANLPTVVMAQCVQSKLAKQRMEQLKKEGYTGEDSYSVVHELMEGTKFKVKVFGEVQVKYYNDNDRQHMEEKVLKQQFFSQKSPDQSGFCRFCIEPTSNSKPTSTGYVSFHRIVEHECQASVRISPRRSPRGPPQRVKRTHDASGDHGNRLSRDNDVTVPIPEELEHLDDVLVTLKQLDTSLNLPDEREYIYNYDDLGSGMFNEINLRFIASKMGADWPIIGTALGFRKDAMERIKLDNPGQTDEQIFSMLRKWAILHRHEKECVETFIEALKTAERLDIADIVKRIYTDGLENFRKKQRRELSDLPGSSSES
uniref:p53-induced death domain-containing protein 1-like n=1 Tax=Phallusia mammillata TaxID=59560 RepID=A0A6F9DN47_9ASCI|nr:p53-induced death domain-containing protein 1-like [Phallusia mammillata]